MKGLFVTATDTGAGKTTLLCRLIPVLEKAGFALCIRKPVESGCQPDQDHLATSDAAALAGASHTKPSTEQVCAYRLRRACSPARAAQLENVELTVTKLAAACTTDNGNTLLVEGAGGFYSPIARDGLNADLACTLGLPLLLLVEDRLGCINHSLLTIEAAQHRRLEIAAVVVNQTTPINNTDTDNYKELKALTDVPVFKVAYTENNRGNTPDIKLLADHLINQYLRNGPKP